MRALFQWLNAHRLSVLAGAVGLVLIGVLSAGSSPTEDEWIRIPDLGFLFAVVLGVLALVGLIIIVLGESTREGERPQGESRSIRQLIILVALVALGIIFFGPDENAELTAPENQEQPTAPVTETSEDASSESSQISGTDIAAAVLIALMIVAGLVHLLRHPNEHEEEPQPPDVSGVKLAPAIERAHRHLTDETDPRTGVLLAYDALETALSELGFARRASETPSEHMRRALAHLPALETPAVRLSRLYEVARFSSESVTERERAEATEMLGRARRSLAATRPEST